MTLETTFRYRERRLTECPACGEPLGDRDGASRVANHIAKHDPEEFGL